MDDDQRAAWLSSLSVEKPELAAQLASLIEELPVGAFWRSRGDDEGGLFRDLDATARRGRLFRRVIFQ